MAVANHALSCHHHGSLIHAPETPTTSKGTFLHRTGLLALPRQNRRPSRIHAASKPNTHATLLESTTGINVDGIVAEAPSLLALSSDLDWQRSVWELRREAREALGGRELALERLGGEYQGWMHDAMFEAILRSDGGAQHVQEEVGVRIRVEELRWQAALQAAEELARGVDSSFDWESEAAEMRQSIVKLQESDGVEQQLLKSWESARHDMDKDAVVLHDEALQSHHQNDLTLFSDAMKEKKPIENALEKSVSWWTLAVAMATGGLGSQAMDAIAAEDSATSAAAAASAAARTAPEWVAPTVLATPVVSYLLFTWYRNAVNPNAKLTDWVFGLIAMAIVGNIVLIATIGVRLY